ncbi:hypothetical protein GCM10007049_01690 [Echinicola pacifica]|uniref:Uncharacterized protein n=2 Tax=Echinicola pacifica TaxID=346377 RepID=A0A918PK04_9BACT|nr:hypothetical protein GCM10007049_01690 [Echinicola pacifica]
MISGVISCTETSETYEEFARNGETIYIGMADTVLLGEGFDKVRLWIAINADPKITKAILKTSDDSFHHEFDIVRRKSGKDTVTVDVAMEEGEYTLGLFLMDDNGNSSVRTEVPAKVYGELYRKSLINRGVNSLQVEEGVVTIKWTSAANKMAFTNLTYTDTSMQQKSIMVQNDETETLITDCLEGSEFEIISSFLPSPRAIELFESNRFIVEYP